MRLRAAPLLLGVAVLVATALVVEGQGGAGGSAVVETADPSPLVTELPSPVIDDTADAGEAAENAAGHDAAGVETAVLEAVEDVQPVRVRIPSIDVDVDIIDLGLNPDGTLEVPSDFGLTGWYTGRSAPGQQGPSVVVGHVDSTSGPAVFFRLHELEAGDLIEIDRTDGLTARFRVDDVVLVQKDEFPTDSVYGSTAEPTLRLITCGGNFDRAARSYLGNLIIYAEHLGNFPIESAAA